MTTGDILTVSLDLGFMPTLILKLIKDFRYILCLNRIGHVTAHSQFLRIKVAKAISQKFGEITFAQTLPVDFDL